METIWKVLSCFVALLFLELCNGLPLDLDHSYTDGHTQFLTGLIAILLTICGVVCLAGCLCCQRRNGFKEFRDSPVVISVASNLDHGHVNPIANGEFTIFTPLSPPHHNNNVFLANQQVITRAEEDYKNGDIDVSSWFGANEKDFPRTRLKYIRELGKGWFGRVVEGTAQGLEEDTTIWSPVVVRILETTASSRQRVLFLHDAAIYRCPQHPNVLKLLGRSLESIPLLLLQEHCTKGDLKRYLNQQKSTKETFLSSDLPLLWCYQLASAVKHLHTFNITHPDLATRNCQLTEDLTLKIGDYGCSMSDFPEDYYHGTENVPVRWCAPECVTYTPTTIQTKNVTTAGNIWSLGVCFWEIYECGSQPYSHLNDDEVVSQVLGPPGIRLNKPSFAVLYTDYVYRLMQLCWSTFESRPSILQIELMLADLLQVHEKTKKSLQPESLVSMQDFDSRWENFKPNVIVKTDNQKIEIIEPENDLTNITVLNMNMSSAQDSKRLSASLHNLAGSFDNLLDSSRGEMDSWNDDVSFVKGLSDAMHDLDNAIASENISSSDSSSPKPTNTKLKFKLGPNEQFVQRTSSESETEDETWRKKIERGAYTEKVRQKSRSVADLMVLTHIDCSESDSETPLPSLDCRFNYKNVRYAPKQNLENISMTFGSEGNLLNVQDTFQQELKKLQEERRDSLLFVPDSINQSGIPNNSPTKKLIEDLNSTASLEPKNQVFNVYNVVTISPKYSPIHAPNLNHLINYKDEEENRVLPDLVLNTIENKRDIPKLSEIIENNIELMDYIITKYDSNPDTLHQDTVSEEKYEQINNNFIKDKNKINEGKKELVDQTCKSIFEVERGAKDFINSFDKSVQIVDIVKTNLEQDVNKHPCSNVDQTVINECDGARLNIFSNDNDESDKIESDSCKHKGKNSNINSEIVETTNYFVSTALNDVELDSSRSLEPELQSQIIEATNYVVCALKNETYDMEDETTEKQCKVLAEKHYSQSEKVEPYGNSDMNLFDIDSDTERVDIETKLTADIIETTNFFVSTETKSPIKTLVGEILDVHHKDLEATNYNDFSDSKIDLESNLIKNPSEITETINYFVSTPHVINDEEILKDDNIPIETGYVSKESHNFEVKEICEDLKPEVKDLKTELDFEFREEILPKSKIEEALIDMECETVKSNVLVDCELGTIKNDVNNEEETPEATLNQEFKTTNINSNMENEDNILENDKICVKVVITPLNNDITVAQKLLVDGEASDFPKKSELIAPEITITEYDEEVQNSSEIVNIEDGKIKSENKILQNDQPCNFVNETEERNQAKNEVQNECGFNGAELDKEITEIETYLSDDDKAEQNLEDNTNSILDYAEIIANVSEISNCENNDLQICKGEISTIDAEAEEVLEFKAQFSTLSDVTKPLCNDDTYLIKKAELSSEACNNKELKPVPEEILFMIPEEKGKLPDELEDIEKNTTIILDKIDIVDGNNLKEVANDEGFTICPNDLCSNEKIENTTVTQDVIEEIANDEEFTTCSNEEKENTTAILTEEDIVVSEALEISNIDLVFEKLKQDIVAKNLADEKHSNYLLANNKKMSSRINKENITETKVNDLTCQFDKTDLVVPDQSEKQSKTPNLTISITNDEYTNLKSEKSIIVTTQDFINNEILTYDDAAGTPQKVKFDLSSEQEQMYPNSLTHSVFTSTPFVRRSLQENSVILGASDDYSIDYYSGLKTTTDEERQMFSSNFIQDGADLQYSLETWDNFLGKSFDEQHDFDSFSSEPKSLLFLDNQIESKEVDSKEDQINETFNLEKTNIVQANETFKIEINPNDTFDVVTETNGTFVKSSNNNEIVNLDDIQVQCDANGTFIKGPKSNESVDLNDINVEIEETPEPEKQGYDNPGYWESDNSSGWFLHPQTNPDDVSGQMDVTQDDSYVGFSMDDEIMAAIRNELMMKLPQAQRASSEHFDDNDGEYQTDRNEVFVRYNCYNTPLSPIPEESYSELLHSGQSTPHCTINTDLGDADSDWSEPGIDPNSILDDDTHSPRCIESPYKGPIQRHTPSQDSCCSNDTLFNLDDLEKLELGDLKNTFIKNDESDQSETETAPQTLIHIEIEQVEDETQVNAIIPNDDSISANIDRSPAVSLNNSDMTHDNMPVDCVNEKEAIECADNTTIKLVIEEDKTKAISDGVIADDSLPTTGTSCEEVIKACEPIITIDSSNCSLKDDILEFLEKERRCFLADTYNPSRKEIEESSSSSETYLTVSDGYAPPNIAPLNSPEDRPWKHIEASLTRCPPELPETSTQADMTFTFIRENSEDGTLSSNSEEEYANEYENVEEMNLKNALATIKADYVNIENNLNENIYDCIEEVKVAKVKLKVKTGATEPACEDVKVNREYVNEVPVYMNELDCDKEPVVYVNEVPSEHKPEPIEYVNTHPEYVNGGENRADLYENVDCENYIDFLEMAPDLEFDGQESVDDVYGPLTDIRFTGPTDSQMMTTSFSDSNDLGDEQDWDSGSDTRSSSSGEFIWKEGEHEASVKALHAAPQDEDLRQSEELQEEEDSSSGSEEGDGPEFVPSAWDKYATPVKSALRSPEKTLDRLTKKTRGVSFKKQKYHCVYEYPREPDSPVVQSFDLWQDSQHVMDWDLDRDSDPFLPATSDTEIKNDTTTTIPQNHSNRQHRNLYQISNVPDFIGSTLLDDDFYISSSAKPFDMFGGLTSQFFPGRHCDWSELIKNNDNVTPDSGVEDITPGSLSDSSDYVKPNRQILPLKTLAQLALNKGAQVGSNEIGGLRHTRNKLKLDLPPSPSAFTKTFSIEPIIDPVITRQVPTFTTFGKSRFVVQQVDTPTDDRPNAKNVSFEALPYKPMVTHIYRDDSSLGVEKTRVESVRGEASLLDSADEDSGIESCTLERKNVSTVTN